MTNNTEQQAVTVAQEIVSAKWCGDADVLPLGETVSVLAYDAAGYVTRSGFNGVPARAACWVRWWPEGADHASFRSCDIADLDIADADYERLSLPCKSGEGAGREALEQAIALIQEAKGIAGDGAVTDHLDFAEHWLGKVEAAIEPILFRAALQGKVDGYTLPLSKEIARSVIDLPASSIERDILALTPDATQTREAELVAALEFYADRDNDGYLVEVTNYGLSTNDGDIIRDGGALARAALNARGGA